ncbi:MAG: lactate racemase domain-containing protein [Acidobacteriota bacterium]|nr:lactate racemase domain-containing protein [Acidobacteriota bacterium]
MGAWFGDEPVRLDFPPAWDVQVLDEGPRHRLGPEQIREKLAQPIGSPTLTRLAAGARRVAIIVDDITRPTPTALLLPPVLDELTRAGLSRSAVTIVIAGGIHRPPDPQHVERKLGAEMADACRVVPHGEGSDVAFACDSPAGIPVFVNRSVAEADLVIGLGGIYPHTVAGFSGGAKIVAPGVCGIETARALHDQLPGAGGRGGPVDNAFRREIEAIAETAGLKFVVNALLTPDRDIADLFAGHPVPAQREGSTSSTPDSVVTQPPPSSTCFNPAGVSPQEEQNHHHREIAAPPAVRSWTLRAHSPPFTSARARDDVEEHFPVVPSRGDGQCRDGSSVEP